MRTSVLIATTLVIVSMGYKWLAKNNPPTPKIVLSWGFILVMLSIVGNTEFSQFSDMIAYLIILIIVLNDGYDMAQSIAQSK